MNTSYSTMINNKSNKNSTMDNANHLNNKNMGTTSHIEHKIVSRPGVVNTNVILYNVVTNYIDNKQLDTIKNKLPNSGGRKILTELWCKLLPGRGDLVSSWV